MLFFKKHIISDKILGCVAQASKDGNLLIILISFLYNIVPSYFLTITYVIVFADFFNFLLFNFYFLINFIIFAAK